MFISRSMRVFFVLYQERNLKAAANKLYLTVPPVSRMLKIMEEWLGEKLFIIERNRVIPTLYAEDLYIKLLPSYYTMNSISKPPVEKSFIISSPYSHTSIITDLLNPVAELSSTPLTIRCSDTIHDDDDIFMSFHKTNASSHFEETQLHLVLLLKCRANISDKWKSHRLLAENAITQQSGFLKALQTLCSQGYKGKVHKSDNVACLKSAFQHGHGLWFQLFENTIDENCILPFFYHQSLFIYTNKLKKNVVHDSFVSHITHICDCESPVYIEDKNQILCLTD